MVARRIILLSNYQENQPAGLMTSSMNPFLVDEASQTRLCWRVWWPSFTAKKQTDNDKTKKQKSFIIAQKFSQEDSLKKEKKTML